MLRVYNLGHDTWQTIYFQRFTVIVTELLLVYALQMYAPYFARLRPGRGSWLDWLANLGPNSNPGSSTRPPGRLSAPPRPLPSRFCCRRAS